MPRSYPSTFEDIFVDALKTITITANIPNIDVKLSEAVGSISGGKTLADLHDKLGSISGSVQVTNFPSDYPDSTAHSLLGSIHAKLSDVKGTIAVNNFPSEYPDTEAHSWLGSIYNRLYDVKGTVNVNNFPTDYPDSVAHDWLGSIYDRQLKVAGNIAAGTVYIGTVEGLIVSSDADRLDLAIYNSGPGTLFIGPSGATFYPIAPDGQMALSFRGELYGSADQPDTLVRWLALKL